MKIKKLYYSLLKYILTCKNYFYFVIGVFFFFSILGFVLPLPEPFSVLILNYLNEIIQKTSNMGFIELFWFIFLNNVKVGFFALIGGFLFGIFPFFLTLVNGYILGFVSSLSVKRVGFSSLLGLIPHGIFELPAIFLSFGLGIKFGLFFFSKNPKNTLMQDLNYLWKILLLIIIPLLLVAGLIESYFIVAFR